MKNSDKRIKLILNPYADRGHAWEMAHIIQGMVERRETVEWASTEFPGHAVKLAEEAGRDGFDIVAAMGGDGTVHEVVNGLMALPEKDRPMMAAVPVGSGNDFCFNVGIPEDTIEAMERIFDGEIKNIDLGLLTDGSGRSVYWDNSMSLGFGASVALHSYRIRRLRGLTMYTWAVIQTIMNNYDAPFMTIQTDSETIEQNVLLLSLSNGAREGGGFFTSPEALPNDGQLNYAMIDLVSRPMMFRLIPEVMRGTHSRFDPIRLGDFRKLSLDSEKPFPIHTDGEIFAGFDSEVTRIEVEVLPGALRIIV